MPWKSSIQLGGWMWKTQKKSMIRQTEHLSIYVFSATQILSRRPTFSNGLINTNRPVYITDNDLATVGVDSMKLLIQ